MWNLKIKKMIVLSLFNGMNTGRHALENVGIKVEKYYSSEIKPYAIELTQYHFPDTIIEHIFSFIQVKK